MMASSDSFFHRWIMQYVDSSYCGNFVIGHLSKDEANSYWDERVTQEAMHCKEIPPLDFEEVLYTSKHLRGKTFTVHQQCALCGETFRSFAALKLPHASAMRVSTIISLPAFFHEETSFKYVSVFHPCIVLSFGEFSGKSFENCLTALTIP